VSALSKVVPGMQIWTGGTCCWRAASQSRDEWGGSCDWAQSDECRREFSQDALSAQRKKLALGQALALPGWSWLSLGGGGVSLVKMGGGLWGKAWGMGSGCGTQSGQGWLRSLNHFFIAFPCLLPKWHLSVSGPDEDKLLHKHNSWKVWESHVLSLHIRFCVYLHDCYYQ
jgi:hypothetical protein